MTSRIPRITQLLSSLHPQDLQIIDESHKHKGHLGIEEGSIETHMTIKIKADFGKINLLQKHRKINALIKEEFDKGLHAVSIEIIQ